MNLFRRRNKSRVTLRVGDAKASFDVPPRAARVIDLLCGEHATLTEQAAEVDRAMLAMRDAYRLELGKAQTRLTEERAAKVEALGKLDAVSVTNLRLRGQVDDLIADLGRARDDERLARQQLAALSEDHVKLTAELLEAQGRLADAEERLAGYQRAEASSSDPDIWMTSENIRRSS